MFDSWGRHSFLSPTSFFPLFLALVAYDQAGFASTESSIYDSFYFDHILPS